MSKKNSQAAKAARRLEREAAKQKQAGSDRTYREPSKEEAAIIESNAAEKKSFGDFTKQQLLKMPVRITFFFDLLLKDDAILEYETDMDRFLDTLLFYKSRVLENPAISLYYHSVLMDMIKSEAPFDEYMFTVGMHYLTSLPCVEHKLRYGLQPLSFRVTLNDENYEPFKVEMSSLADWLIIRDKCFETLLNNKNKQNEAA
ncbi:MAG: hypothetical protein J0I09_10455 [Sphingobacteriia bacterium]|nr:hypothetical protein [Sphingobacteriia bacterium]